MRPEPQIVRWSRWVVEACLLLAVTLTPLYFNIYSARHFEPDKATALRTIVLLALTAAGVLGWSRRSAAVGGEPQRRDWRMLLREQPLLIAGGVYAVVYLLTTITSIVPAVSLWGSYQRLQGTYSVLSYVALGALVPLVLQVTASRERWLRTALAAAATVAGYGVLQANQLDPLPWRGDVVTRVASTMGNSIFVAAYLIMMVPPALARSVAQWRVMREARPNTATVANEVQFALANLLHWIAGVMTVMSTIAFSGQVRAGDGRFWWVFPAAVITATVFWAVPVGGRGRAAQVDWRPFGSVLSFALLFGMFFAAAAAAVSTVDDGRGLWQWWHWLLGAVVAAGAAGGLATRGRELPVEPSRLAQGLLFTARSLLTALLVLVILFTQSRGPWIGLAAGIFIFGLLLVIQLRRAALLAGAVQAIRRWTAVLIGWFAATAALGSLLIAFNVSQAPLFEQLRNVPYLGRMGRLLEVDSGTGLVRLLIWNGDEHAGGALGLIASDPLRTWIGWGPESMFVAYTPHYPPSLANVEARGASPDRSHQALLDELVTRGILGLVSYLAVLATVFWTGFRVLRRQLPWAEQVLVVAIMSAVTAYVVEGLTGIPITATQMLLWLFIGLLAAYAAQPQAAAAAAPETISAAASSREVDGSNRSVRRGTAGRGRSRSAPAAAGALSRWWLVGGLTLALMLGWFANQRPVSADMLFHQAQGLSETATDGTTQIRALTRALESIRLNPNEDFYYLNFGRMLLSIGESKRAQGADYGVPVTVDVGQLLALRDEAAVTNYVVNATPLELLGGAEAVLQRAQQLSPLNKDHLANLARISTIAFVWTGDVTRLATSAERYRGVTDVAPNDVALLNEYAGIVLQQAQSAQQAGDTAAAEQYFTDALALLNHSNEIDPRYGDTYQRRADLLRVRDGDPEAALADYVQAIASAPDSMAGVVDRLLQVYAGRPASLAVLRDAYATAADAAVSALDQARGQQDRVFELPSLTARATQLLIAQGRLEFDVQQADAAVAAFAAATVLNPDDVTASRWYATVLSATLQHEQALDETSRIAARMQLLGRTQELAAIEELRTAIAGATN